MNESILGQVFLFGSIILIMYFFMIRPQQKKQKDTKKFIDEIKKGDDVVTIGGLHGKVYSVDGDTVQIELDRGLKVKIEKSAISLDFSKKSTTTK
ncbi:preprotein translocase subunit YajC [Algoriphagus alkaliphilus]|jgi:preprotein translocase subunit YajC|uniref:Sec translocon accessory complex subunit YajC n=1 Tax=Algoriphagus alkaliphilus TaxID=279824 RepID=A0A1G5WLY6_9BACT|nr:MULTISPECIES: preprotein translocase subunit YajC [Algoriphagus]MBA4300572.1 preprotein translocase subunit YajC [Cyclobacterium sp.]MDO8968259.1 preprotein translocase subunit YajC [Algoriphagus sp.]MDP2043098.1 preprotein translocase subunit YajC [Algoriphagus sp.]MDP3200054.1 preprotein translocase subunit YajC [Algoriphagus sp.]MDP3473964.1 preprotein translocase subunit YajC [Algoriphagus sp.]